MDNRYQMHVTIEQQVQASGDTNLCNYLRDLVKRDTRVHEGKVSHRSFVLNAH